VIIAIATTATTVMTRAAQNDKKHAYEFCNGYSLGHTTKWIH